MLKKVSENKFFKQSKTRKKTGDVCYDDNTKCYTMKKKQTRTKVLNDYNHFTKSVNEILINRIQDDYTAKNAKKPLNAE